MPNFKIQQTSFEAMIDPRGAGPFLVDSVPYPYEVEFVADRSPLTTLEAAVQAASHPMLLIDRRVEELYLSGSSVLASVPTLSVDATEDYKQVYSAIELAEFMEGEKATKASMLFVVGGGIVQDVGAFGAAMYKRGIPWTYFPTTLLAQGDSCIGGKTGLNHKKTKNLVALFSAPRKVVIHPGFLDTLPNNDVLSGLGEVFRLHITGGPEFFATFEANLRRREAGDCSAILDLLVGSLSVKRAVVEFDEFERDLRRSLNYGHSLGHAIEALVGYRIPHGTAVTIGVLAENEVSMRRGLLSRDERDRMLNAGRALVPASARAELERLELDNVIELLRRDKKTLGTTLKLVVCETIGQIRFIDFELEPSAIGVLKECLSDLLRDL